MAYPGNFLRLVASGTIFTAETWSFGMSLVPDFDGTPDVYETVPQGILDALADYIDGGAISSEVRLTTVKLNLIGPNGRYVNQGETVLHEYPTPGVAGGGTPRFPSQVSLVVSLRTDKRRGLAHAGRFYSPGPSLAITNDGRVSAADIDIQVGNVTTLLNAINAAVDGYQVGVASDVGGGRFERVTSARIGRVLDTMRSRRTSLDEAYREGARLASV